MDSQHVSDPTCAGTGIGGGADARSDPDCFDPQAICLRLQLSPEAHRQICALGLGEITQRVQWLASWEQASPSPLALEAATLEHLLHGLASSLQLAGDAGLGAALRALELGLREQTRSPEQALAQAQALLPALQRTRQALACYVASGPGVAQG